MSPKRTAKALGRSGSLSTTTSPPKRRQLAAQSLDLPRSPGYRRYWCSCPHRLSRLEHIQQDIKKNPQMTMGFSLMSKVYLPDRSSQLDPFLEERTAVL